ncbi:hypothetical protein H4217_001493 [Coemansia sp. RSA 1939]|nr:hypothetical protein H4217_001493 [Coemansia sp. RSA 1939]KAJ2615502.1 hypothetical protein EV177_001541 [Coemansia sp. RSA 1804]
MENQWSGQKSEATLLGASPNNSNNVSDAGSIADTVAATDPRDWSVEQTTAWVQSVLAKRLIPEEYESNGIDGAALVEGITYRILHTDLGFKVGPALTLMRQVERLRVRWGVVPMDLDTREKSGSGGKHTPPGGAEVGSSGSVHDSLLIKPASPLSTVTSPSLHDVATDASPPPPIYQFPNLAVSASDGTEDNRFHQKSGVESSGSEAMQISDESGQSDNNISTSTSSSVRSGCTSSDPARWERAVCELSQFLDARRPHVAKKDDKEGEEEESYQVVQPRRMTLLSALCANRGSSEAEEEEEEDEGNEQRIVEKSTAESGGLEADAGTRPDKRPGSSSSSNKKEDKEEDEEPGISPPRKIRRRMAPSLLTTEIPAIAVGNIIEQGVAEERLWIAPAQPLPLEEARSQLALLFPQSTLSSTARRPAAAAQPTAGAQLLLTTLLPGCAISESDTMWFRRTRPGRTPGMAARMQQVQKWHRRLILRNDAMLYTLPEEEEKEEEGNGGYGEDRVLPLYGESNSDSGSGAVSDGLHREIQREQNEARAHKKRAASGERQRVALVERVIDEMVDRYTDRWHAKAKPRLARRQHFLWKKYRPALGEMERELGDLQTRRLPRARMAVVDSGVRTRRRATALCVGLQSTVDLICRTAWLVALVRGSRPEHPARKRRASRSEKSEEKPNAAVVAVSPAAAVPGRLAIADSTSSSNSMADFIDDNDDDGSEEKEGVAAAFVAGEQVVVNGVIGGSATPQDQTQNQDQDHDQDQETDQRLDQGEEQSPLSGSQKLTPHSRPATPDAQPEEKIPTPRTKYARRSMAAKELDNEPPGASLADSEQDKTLVTGRVQRERKTTKKKAKKKEPERGQAAEVQMMQEELAQATSRHTAAQMYEAAVALIRRLAAPGGLAEIKESGGSVDARIALRVWAEFQGWLAASNSDTSGSGGSVCARFADVGDALVRRTTGARPQEVAGAGEGSHDAPQPSPARFAAFWARRRAEAADGVCAPVLANPGRRVGSATRDAWIPGFLAWRLHEHQMAGVRFAWRAAIEGGDSNAGGDSIGGGGCVLAHAMGLGKTLQAVALIYTLLSEVSAGAPGLARFASRRVLVLCPPTVQDNWVAEFARWTGVADTLAETPAPPPELPPPSSAAAARAVQLRARRVLVQVVHFGRMRTRPMRDAAVRGWQRHGGVLVMGYAAFRDAMSGGGADGAGGALGADGGPCLVVADEAHVLKNRESRVAALAATLATHGARVCLTGSPLQNRLEEYWAMADFCRPGLLGDLRDFRASFAAPIAAGLYADSSPGARRLSQTRLRVLRALLAPIVDRRSAEPLVRALPRKVEFCIACPLTPPQAALYRALLAAGAAAAETPRLFEQGVRLGLLCNHPAASKPGASAAWAAQVDEACAGCSGGDVAALSAKMALALALVRLSVRLAERVLVFSRSLATLDLLQRAVDAELPRGVSPCLRIDGGTPVAARQPLVDEFNSAAGARVFLISAATASVGVNLPAASRVVIFDVGWNPLYDDQAVARAYRFGQRRRVYVYRLMAAGVWEEQLFRSNVFKVALTRRVVDAQPMSRWAARADLKRYFAPPPPHVPSLAPGEALRLADEYKDDLVFAAVMRAPSLRALVASVTPHATLLANEDDSVLAAGAGPGDSEESLEMLVRCERERLGQIAASTAASATTAAANAVAAVSRGNGGGVGADVDIVSDDDLSDDLEIIETIEAIETVRAAAADAIGAGGPETPATLAADSDGPAAAAETASAPTPTTAPSLPSSAQHYEVCKIEAMLASIIIRLERLPLQAPLKNPANLTVFTALFSEWFADVQNFIGIGSLDAECRRTKAIADVRHCIPNADSIIATVLPMFRLSDAALRRVVESHTQG